MELFAGNRIETLSQIKCRTNNRVFFQMGLVTVKATGGNLEDESGKRTKVMLSVNYDCRKC